MATLADVFKLYVKPSLKGRLIIRKRTVNRKSPKVIENNKTFAEMKIAKGCGGKGWAKFISCVRENSNKLPYARKRA